MNRRKFLRDACATAATISCASSHLLRAQESSQIISATLTIDESATLVTIPADFIGLSYESAQLANPAFFSAENAALIALFRELCDQGVLRLGGGTSEFTAFTTDETPASPPLGPVAVGPDNSKTAKTATPITPKSHPNLHAFLDATNWRCLYGLNLGRGPVERAAEEAYYAQNILGPRLIAFQLGNEPDAWRNRYRPATWSYADYWKEWTVAHAAVAARVPNAKFAGPDVSNKMAFVTGFAEDAKSARDVVMLTSHYYAMGPAGAPGMTIDRLLSPDPKLEHDLQIAITAARSAGLPYRMSEGNSCWNGGQQGVSDTFASALWVADTTLDFAAAGCAGVNLHGGGNGFYTPIAGSLESGFLRRPEFYGIELLKPFAGASLVRSSLDCSSDRVRAYAARKSGVTLLLALNKTAHPIVIKCPIQRAHRRWLLSGPAVDSTTGVTLVETHANSLHAGALRVPPFTAILLEA